MDELKELKEKDHTQQILERDYYDHLRMICNNPIYNEQTRNRLAINVLLEFLDKIGYHRIVEVFNEIRSIPYRK